MRLIDKKIIDKLLKEAEQSSRKRAHLLLHSNHQEPVQRILIGLVKGSFVEPHYHKLPTKWEMFSIIHGELSIKIYDDLGNVTQSETISNNEAHPKLIEFQHGEIHSVECMSETALILEIKEGPFIHKNAKFFPSWGL
ncbi:cupin fold metalloprotein, WbuC family [Pseudidiomarina gelatinasegens]|uniref:Cupin fold metalloprotein, WbuC family n=1 Tax=Pseudidiomarina gelatinasegens TaxID=2487740 RepID=A0A443Z7V2_9GAMM|nr:WbuC family cupin fold metalloprotein [Pseudidiomarina gelatinasegens]RWU12941.1 cupin fold metalloprotein, WbuC family [Pseudidiomarina gelatinasegens]